MLKQTLYKEGLVFSSYQEDVPVDFRNWPDTNDYEKSEEVSI